MEDAGLNIVYFTGCGGWGVEEREMFQERADDAGVIIAVLSSNFIHSRTCQQQVLYILYIFAKYIPSPTCDIVAYSSSLLYMYHL